MARAQDIQYYRDRTGLDGATIEKELDSGTLPTPPSRDDD